MSAQLIDGKALAEEYRKHIAQEVERLKKEGIAPGLAVIIVGEDPASQTYVKNKHKACQKVGIHSKVITLPEDTEQNSLLEYIHALNADPYIHGILVQLPLPQHIEETAVTHAISAQKDVDGFHPTNMGKLVIGEKAFLPCTPHGIVKMVKSTGMSIAGKNVVILGRSNIVGKPLSLLFLREHATVTICHSRTDGLVEKTREADILVVAVGSPGMIGKEHVKEGAVVIDVGINRTSEGKLTGDVRFDELKEWAGYLTPVPGGVGPMTITMLLFNTLESARRMAR